MKNIRLSPASSGLLVSLFCGATTILFGYFWFLSAASEVEKEERLEMRRNAKPRRALMARRQFAK